MIHTPQTEPAGPIDPKARLGSVDAVRGFALFGVLLVNMYNFGAAAPQWTGTLDSAFYQAMHSLFETKSMRLFSMLFGFGFALQLAGVISRKDASMWLYVRRLTILFAFGMAHALFYDGDILMEYAMLGLILIAFRNAHRLTLLVLPLVLLAVFPVANLVGTQSDDDLANHLEDTQPLAELRAEHPYLGSPMDVFEENAFAIPPQIWLNLGGPESSLVIFSMLLFGLYIGRSRIVHDITSHICLVRSVCAWGIGLGALSALIEWWLTRNYGYAVFTLSAAKGGIRFFGDMLFAYGSTALALGYGAGIVLLAQRSSWSFLIRPLQNLGRMALTVYLCSTVMFTTLFYGWGFGQLFLLGPVETTFYALMFFLALMVFCSCWLARFRFGPAEWVWRSFTYVKVQTLRRN